MPHGHNFNVIHHQYHHKKLENPEQYCQMIYDKHFLNYKNHVQNEVTSAAIKYEVRISISNLIF